MTDSKKCQKSCEMDSLQCGSKEDLIREDTINGSTHEDNKIGVLVDEEKLYEVLENPVSSLFSRCSLSRKKWDPPADSLWNVPYYRTL